jgi:hypothetical protein
MRHQDGLETALKQVPDTPVRAVDMLRVQAVELRMPLERLASGVSKNRWSWFVIRQSARQIQLNRSPVCPRLPRNAARSPR